MEMQTRGTRRLRRMRRRITIQEKECTRDNVKGNNFKIGEYGDDNNLDNYIAERVKLITNRDKGITEEARRRSRRRRQNNDEKFYNFEKIITEDNKESLTNCIRKYVKLFMCE